MADRLSAFAELMARIGYPERGANLARAAQSNPALAKRIDEVIASGDPAAGRKLLADFTSLSDNPRVQPRDPNMPYDMKPSTDDVQRRLVRADLGPIGDLPMPAVSRALGDLVAADGADGLLEQLGRSAPQPLYALDLSPSSRVVSQAEIGGPGPTTLRARDIQRAHASARDNWPVPHDATADDIMAPDVLAQFPSAEQRVLRELAANEWLGFDYPSQAMDAALSLGSPTRWDMTPGLLAARAELIAPRTRPIQDGGGGYSVTDVMPGAAVPESPGTALVPAGPRDLSAGGGGGLIVPPGRSLTTTGGPRDLSVPPRGMESPEPRRLPAPGQRRIEGPPPRRGADARRPDIDDPEVPPRPARGGDTPRRARRVDPRLAAAGVGALATGVHLLTRPAAERPARPPEGRASTTADLAAETAPPPRVPVASGELTPREQAHELIARLNLMRRNAGGEVPEAPAMLREINRLLELSNQTMAAASRGEVAMAGNDPHAQATRLLAQLNQMRREAGGEVPQARQIMAEVARLQQMGDAQRNARTTAFPRRAG